jgi:hypothetical protein
MAGTSLGTLVTYNPWSVASTALLEDIATRFTEAMHQLWAEG